MARVEGSIKKRGEATDAPYLVRVYKGEENGRRKYVSKTVATLKEAKQVRRDLLGRKDKGKLVVPSRVTFGAYLQQWLATDAAQSVGPRTHRDYSEYIGRYVMPFPIASKRLSQLTHDDIAMRYAEMRAAPSARTRAMLSPRTVRYLHVILTSALKQAVATGTLSSNPTEHVRLPRQERIERRALTQAEADAFLDAVIGDAHEAYFTVLMMTGMRPQEAAALRWSDRDGDWLTIRKGSAPGRGTHQTKTRRSERRIALGSIARAVLDKHKTEQDAHIKRLGAIYDDQGFIFARPNGAMANTTSLDRKPFDRILKKAGISKYKAGFPTLRVYDATRHTSISLALASGVDVLVTAQRAGHANATLVLTTYGHVLEGAQEAATAKLEAGFRRAEKAQTGVA